MFKLLLTTSLLGPFIFFSGAEVLYAKSQFQELDELSPLDRKVVSMSKCEASDLYIFFHEEYIEMHSMDHLSSAIQASTDCDIKKITVSYAAQESESLDDTQTYYQRSEELKYIFNTHYSTNSVSFNTDFDVVDTVIADESVAKISFEFDKNPAVSS